ncbi:uncharacterized protein LOC106648078 isoform X1 [Trichogramma pretiosum]|uniref:uncharacterized protein LOC106648078 isoform X1 n=1 Tax=Trichogramma pretiosum TaxID=7493 RepID=UPI0006C95B69|nr:uncharacterized protein LOC106648078 isoform X1 [Trichogramma pretiosum]
MTDFRERYKRVGFGRENAEVNRALRSQRRDEARRDRRDEHLSSLRGDFFAANENSHEHDEEFSMQSSSKKIENLTNSEMDAEAKRKADEEKGVQKRLQQLEKWREERNRRKQQEKKKAKPVFKVGVVHHKVYSPPTIKDTEPMTGKLCKSHKSTLSEESHPKKITRATEKRLAVKAITNQQKAENNRLKKKQELSKKNIKQKIPKNPLISIDHQFKAPNGVTPLPVFGRCALEKNKNNKLDFVTNRLSFSDIELPNSSFNMTQSSLTSSNITFGFGKSKRRSNMNELPSASNFLVPAKDTAADHAENDSESKVDFSMFKMKSFKGRRSSRGQPLLAANSRKSEISGLSEIKEHKTRRKSKVETTSIDLNLTRENTANGLNYKEMEENDTRSNLNINSKHDTLETNENSEGVHEDQKMEDIPSSEIKNLSSSKLNESVPRNSSFVLKFEESPDKPLSKSPAKRKSIKSPPNVEISETSSPKKKLKNKRHSIGTVSNTETSTLNYSPKTNNETIITPKNIIIDNVPNLMDFTFSDPATGFRRPTTIPNELQNQSLMKFSPRQSARLSRLKSSPSQVKSSTSVDSHNVIQSPKVMNKSTSSEPTIEQSPEKLKMKDLHNSSLNISLPKDETPDRPLAFFSPYIVTSRGKSSVRKEVQKKRFSQGLRQEEIPTKETVMQNLNISIEDEEKTAQYYKFILDREIERLNERCDTWNTIKESDGTPEDIVYQILAAVGQTQLLIRKKFERFRRLVLDCETGKGEMLVTCKDLQGFWEMMYMEIKDCDNRFNRLEDLKTKNWVDEEQERLEKEKFTKKKPAPKKTVVKKKPIAAKSNMRALILAARKKKMESNENGADNIEIMDIATKPAVPKRASPKTATPSKIARRSLSTPVSEKRRSLLQKVQLSQHRKEITTSPLIQMKIAKLCKTPEVQRDESIIYINSDRTPAKGILKSNINDGNKSIKQNKVIFKEAPVEFPEFDKLSDVGNDDYMDIEPIERKLNFEDDSFNSSFVDNDEKELERKSPTISEDTSKSSLQSKKSSNTPGTRKSSKLKVIKSQSSPMLSMSPLSLEDSRTEKAVKHSSSKKKHISFQCLDKNYDESPKSGKLSTLGTPKPKKKIQIENDTMEVDDNVPNSHCDSTLTDVEANTVTEFYMNEKGMICERKVPVKSDTPRTNKLKRSNSEKVQKTANSTTPLNISRLRRRTSTLEVNKNSPSTSATPNKTRKSIATPSPRRPSKKKISEEVDAALVDNSDSTPEVVSSPKIRKNLRVKKSVTGLDEMDKPTNASKLRRTKSLVVKSKTDVDVTEKPLTSKIKRTGSLRAKSSVILDGVTKISSPSTGSQFSKIMQENVEPNTQKPESTNRSLKILRTPILKRNKSNAKDELGDGSTFISNSLTPSSQRKSLRTRVKQDAEK